MVILSFGANDGKKISPTAKRLMGRESWLDSIKYFLWNFKTYKLLRKIILSSTSPFEKVGTEKQGEEPKVPFATLQEFRDNLEYIVDRYFH